MTEERAPAIRVVLFCGGPTLARDVALFMWRLEQHPDIDLLGAFCQSRSQTVRGVIADRWRRRRFLAIPLLLSELASLAGRYVARPQAELALRRQLAQCAHKVHYVADIHAPDVLRRVRELKPDLGLVYGSPILKPALFEIPRLGTLGIHHGKVPEYRGKKTTFWAMYNGEPTVGVTIQKISAGLDRGHVVAAGEVPVGRRTLGAVWQDLESLGIQLYMETILAVRDGRATYRPQPAGPGRLYRDPSLHDLVVFWWRQVRRHLWSRRNPA